MSLPPKPACLTKFQRLKLANLARQNSKRRSYSTLQVRTSSEHKIDNIKSCPCNISGQCRLIGQNNGKLSSIALMDPGTFVGLASLLRAEPCEEISAASEIEALSLPDSLIVDIYATDKFFRDWCNTTVFAGEAATQPNH